VNTARAGDDLARFSFSYRITDLTGFEAQMGKYCGVSEDLFADCWWEGLFSPGMGKRSAIFEDP